MNSETIEQTIEQTTGNMPNGNGNGAGSPASFAELLEQYDIPTPERGQFITGEIMRIDDDVLFVDVGAKRDAIVPHNEVDRLGKDLLDSLSQGDEVPVYVTRTPLGEEELLVSLEKGLEQEDWDRAEEVMEADETVELKVIGHNKGGLLVEFGRIRGFVPNSHEPELRHIHDKPRRVSYKAKQEGETLPLKVIEIDRSRERLVLSATAAERELRKQQLQELEEGETITGTIVHITDYGAFVDLGHVTGLLHISKIAWERIDHPKDVLAVGEEVEVVIDDIDIERERISLNRRVLQPSPWDRFLEEHDVGDLVEGIVTDTVDFGAFVLVSEGIEGLVHISEMNISRGEKPESALQPGDAVLARIIKTEPKRDRLSLSMRRVSAAEEVQWMMGRRQDEAVSAEAIDETQEEEGAPQNPTAAHDEAEDGDITEASASAQGEEEEE